VTEEGLVAVAEGRGPELIVNFEGRVLFTGGQRAGPGVFADRDGLKQAVNSWSSDKARAEVKYGPIGGWDVSRVTDMSSLFMANGSFNEDISRWNVSEVTNMRCVWSDVRVAVVV
jgi:surface protein